VSGSAALTNFPVLVSVTDSNLQASAQSNGNDILFTASDGVSKLPHEIEKYTSSNGNLIAWVKVPSVSPANDTVIYMYYGNSSAADQQNKTAVWDSNYKGVWHLGNGTAADSTNNANNGTITGTAATTGQIAGGTSFAGGTDKIAVNSAMGSPATAITLEGWANVATSGQAAMIVVGSAGGGCPNGVWLTPYYAGSVLAEGAYGAWCGAGIERIIKIDDGSTPGSGWRHWAYTVDKTNNIATLYTDGIAVGTSTASFALTYGSANTTIGVSYYGGTVVSSTAGLDEVRVSDTARSANWIQTGVNNQKSPGTFLTVGPQQ
jgi:hypothetical protein